MGKSKAANRIRSIVLSLVLVLGMLPGSIVPVAKAVIDHTDDRIYAAAYMGTESIAGTTLPDTILLDDELYHVDWDIDMDTFMVPYETVDVTGTAENGVTVQAKVEVIPPADHPLVYYVDSGRGGDSLGNGPSDSPLYEAVKELAGSTLVNQAPDQRYAAGSNTWGFDDSTQQVKNSKDGGHTDPATDPSKWVVGLRASNNDIVYRLESLEPGTYTLTSGFHDWYGNRSRVIRPRIDYRDLNGQLRTIQLDQFNTNNTWMISSEFTIPADIDPAAGMTLTYAYVSNEKPILSWFAIAQGSIKGIIAEAQQRAASIVNVLVDGNDIRADNRNGLTFKGFGVLSANSTSALLMDYKAQHPDRYIELLQLLFGGENPIMTHVKIEMGNDRNNSTGPDPATKRTEDEPANVRRHPGFQLAADAKKINPDVKVSILRWNAPAWANTNEKIYKWYKETILAAYREFGYMVDYVNPHINEKAPDLAWTKQYAEWVRTDNVGFASEEEQKLYNSIKVVISDEVGIGSFGGAMVSDATLRDAVSVAAYHYNTDDDSAGNFKRLAEQFDIQVWNSEAQATFSNTAFRPNNNTRDPSRPGTGIGGAGSALEMANTIIKGFVNSRRTLFIYQPAIGSFYEGGQYSFKELVSARDPWSGWIHYDAGLTVLQHFSSFAKIGWENEDNTAGIWRAIPQSSYTGATGTNPINGRNGTPSYMTLAAPDRSDFSTVFVNDSEYDRIYKIKVVNMAYTGNPDLEVWETRAAEEGQSFNSNYMRYLGKVSANGQGYYTVTVKPYSIVTVTTLSRSEEEDFPIPLPVEGERTVLDTDETGARQDTGDDILYADRFDYSRMTVVVLGEGGEIVDDAPYIDSFGGPAGVIPRYTHDRNGAFEAYLVEETGEYVLRQQLDRDKMGLGGTWNNGDPVTAIGDFRWLNYRAGVSVSFETNSTAGGQNYAVLGARYQGGGNSHSISGTPYVLKFWFDGGWQLLVNGQPVASGNVVTGSGGVKIEDFDASYNAWHRLEIEVAGNRITAYLDGVKLATYIDPNPKLSGRVDLGSGYYHVRFDDLWVEMVDGYSPYYSEHLDNLEMHDLSDPPNRKLIYDGPWAHANGQGMYHYHRSLSTSQGPGASLEYTFVGTGLDILGPNDGSARLKVTVDGEPLLLAAETKPSAELYQTFTLRGLPYGEHTVRFEVVSGTLVVDSVAVISGEVLKVRDGLDLTALAEAVEEAGKLEKSDLYREADWQLFERALATAELALEDPDTYRLDQEGANQLLERLLYAQNQLISGDLVQLAGPVYAATHVGDTPKLPATVEATREGGSTVMVPVTWELDGVSFDEPYQTVTVRGSYGSLNTTAYVEVVPRNLLYFADVNATEQPLSGRHDSSNTLGYDSPAWKAITELGLRSGTPLLNGAPDQVYNGDNGWGHGGHQANGQMEVYYKGIVTGAYSKMTTTGIYTANQIGASLTYTFDDLPPGEYSVTIGSHSWWPTYPRASEVYLEYDGKSQYVDRFPLDTTSNSLVRTYTFTKEEEGSFTVRIRAVDRNESPMLSFVGLAAISVSKTALIDLYNGHLGKDESLYTADSWAIFEAAMALALSVIEDDEATPTDIILALRELKHAAAGLEPVDQYARTSQVFATYVNELPQLPERIRLVDGGPEFDVIAWTIDGSRPLSSADFAVPYATVPVYGAYDDNGLKQYAAYVEVVPRNLVYYIDAGPSVPAIYNAVRKLTGSALLNDKTNQVYNAADGWGYIALSSGGAVRDVINKSGQDDLDKNGTGIMIDGGDPGSTLAYRLDGLEGGKSYRFISYHRLWWNNEMPFKIEIRYDLDGRTVTQLVNRLHLDHEGHSQLVTYSIQLPEGASNVRYVLTNVGSYTQGPGAGKINRNAPISWLAVEELPDPAEPVRYSTIGGIAGANTDVWFDTEGKPIQAHGGQVIWIEHVAWDGDVPHYEPNPADGDGAWLWLGEDKSTGGQPAGGFHAYVSRDLYNWVDMGVIMYSHRVFPMELTEDGQGIRVSETQLAALKARAMGIGLNEFGQPLSESDIAGARDFLQAYVDRNVHPDYDRKNDANFDYQTASYDEASLRLAFDRTYGYYAIMERPKMLYNDNTGKYVLVYHVDGPTDSAIRDNLEQMKSNPYAGSNVSRYSRAEMGFAVSDSPFGPFKLVNSQRMNYVIGQYDHNPGMARDMTVFKDDDGKAYAIYSSEENQYTYISLLNDSYTGPVSEGVNGRGVTFVDRVFPDNNREAPAIFKYDGYYYFITSGTTGWDPNPSIAYRANHIFGNTSDGGQTFTGYTRLGNPFPQDSSNTSYRSQSTAVIPYDPENGLFIYMGDRWIQRSLESSGYVWLPLKISANGMSVEGVPLSDWTLDQLEEYAPIKVLTEPASSKLGAAPTLPSVLDVQRGSEIYRNVPVSWDPTSIEEARLMLGKTMVRGTLGGELAGRTVEYEISVWLPDETIYFANPAHGEVTQYTQLVRAFEQETGKKLRNSVHDQAYAPASGNAWGYVGTNSAIRDDTENIFESLRYETNQGDRSLTYKFDVEQGIYNVYIGFFDPWYQWSQGKRLAYTTINGVVVEQNRNIRDRYEIAEHLGIELAADGTLTVTVSPHNTGRDTDVQLSFVIVTRVGPEPEPQPDTTKPVITLLGEPEVRLHVGEPYEDAGATAWDDRDGDLTEQIVVTVTSSVYGIVDAVDTSYPDTFTIRYNVSDSAGNAADEVTRTVIVEDRDEPEEPEEPGEPEEPEEPGGPEEPEEPGGPEEPEEPGGPEEPEEPGGPEEPGEPEEPEDPADPDVTPPVITLKGPSTIYLVKGESYTDPGASAWDDRDGDITHLIGVTVTRDNVGPVDGVDTSVVGIYKVHYNVRDSSGNAADEVTRTVVVNPGSDPVITPPPPPQPPKPSLPPLTEITILPDAQNGIILKEVEPGTDGFLIPLGIRHFLGDNKLVFAQDNIRVYFTAEVLEMLEDYIKQFFGTVDGSDFELIFILKRLDDADTSAIMEKLEKSSKENERYRVVGNIYELQFAYVGEDGRVIWLSDILKQTITIVFNITPESNTLLMGIYYIRDDGVPLYVGGEQQGDMMMAHVDHFSKYALMEYDRSFSDVDESLWAYQVIKAMVAKHIMQGVSEDRFDPHGLVTRAQFATMIARALGLKANEPAPFADVPAGAWYAEAVSAANAAGIVRGRSEQLFAPDVYITREEMAVMLMRAYAYATGNSPSTSQASGYLDADRISDWAREAVLQAQVLGLMKGRGNSLFDPQAPVTRAEGAQAVWNFLTIR